MAYQIGLCDDELYQIKVNGLFLKEIATRNNLELEYHGFLSGEQLKKYLTKKEIDILFLDIDLGGESGIKLATQLSHLHPQMVIAFVTGHREFMEEAFGLDVMGYLVKPYEISRMERVLYRSLLQVSALKQHIETPEITITDENLKKKIVCKNIIYIQRQQYKSLIVTEKKEYGVYEPLKSLCERIGTEFVRVNQSEVVNMKYIEVIENNNVILKNGMKMPIGRTYRKELFSKYFGNK